MLMATTTIVGGRPVREYLGIVTGEVIVGANIIKDFLDSIRDNVEESRRESEKKLSDARKTALDEAAQEALSLGADAVILDLEDSVIPEEKDAARFLVTNAIRSLNFGQTEVSNR